MWHWEFKLRSSPLQNKCPCPLNHHPNPRAQNSLEEFCYKGNRKTQTGNLRSIQSQNEFSLRWERLKSVGGRAIREHQANTLGQTHCPSKISESKDRWLTAQIQSWRYPCVQKRQPLMSCWHTYHVVEHGQLLLFYLSMESSAEGKIRNQIHSARKEEKGKQITHGGGIRCGSTKRTQKESQNNISTFFIMW